MWRRAALLLALPAVLVAPAGCAVPARSGPTVVASFYPLQFVAERIVGSHARVLNLTAPGVEPHDLELTVRQTAEISAATVVLYEHGLQPSVDEAVADNGPAHVLDTTTVVPLHGGDPHFWQDPILLARVARAFTRTVSRAQPDHAAAFRANDARLQRQLRALDADFRRGLAHCRTRTLVVSHDAFEYLGRRYHLDVEALAGITPDAEPSPRHLEQISRLVRTRGITTLFNERLASPQLVDALSHDLGVHTGVLDTLEGLSATDPHADYLSVMRSNLAAIRKADSC
ncbi:MAG TPA: metal ABC transporter substrate-binding protein [Marmoricola sp.]|nr:metal ABC transporter substrate-binding protein [Marmoricola sp.]